MRCLLILTPGALEVHAARSSGLASGMHASSASHPQLSKLQQVLADAADTPRSLISAAGNVRVPHLPISSMQAPASSEGAPSEASYQTARSDPAATPRKKSFGKRVKSFTQKLSKLSVSSRATAPSNHSGSQAAVHAALPADHAGQQTPTAPDGDNCSRGSFTFPVPPSPQQQTPTIGPTAGGDAMEHIDSLSIALQQARL